MFVDFDNVFNRKTSFSIPQSLVEYYSAQLPDGLVYKEEDGILYIVDQNSSEKHIGKVIPELTAEIKKGLGDHTSFSDLMQLLYNSQQSICLSPQDGESLTFNDKEIRINQMIISPFKNNEVTKLYITPPPFPPPKTVRIKNDKYEEELHIKRIPNNSVNVIMVESEKDKPLFFHASIDTENSKNSNLSFKYNLSNAHTIRDLAVSLSLYNSLFEGTAFFDGAPIPKDRKVQGVPINKQSLQFWEKVLKIEDLLELRFVPPSEDVQNEDVYLVEQLYQSLINKTPTRSLGQVNTLQGKWKSVDEKTFKSMPNTITNFSYSINSTISLFDQSFNLFCFVGIFGVLVEDCSIDNDSFFIKMKDPDGKRRSYMSVMYFLNEESVEDYLSNYDKAIEALEDAKSVLEFLD